MNNQFLLITSVHLFASIHMYRHILVLHTLPQPGGGVVVVGWGGGGGGLKGNIYL